MDASPMLAHASQHHTRPCPYVVAGCLQSGRGLCTRRSWASVIALWLNGSSFAGAASGLSAGPSWDGDRMLFRNEV